MNLERLVGEKVIHTTLGEGKIIDISEVNVTVKFNRGGVQFYSFPNTFRNNILRFIEINHDEVLDSLDKKEEPKIKTVFAEEEKVSPVTPISEVIKIVDDKPQQEEKEQAILRPIRIKKVDKPILETPEEEIIPPLIEQDELNQIKPFETPIEVVEEKELDIGVEFLDETDQMPVIDDIVHEDVVEAVEQVEELEAVVREEVYKEETKEETAYDYDAFLSEFYEYAKNKKLLTYIVVKYVNDEVIFKELKSLVLKIILETLDREPKDEERVFVTLFIAMVAYKHYDGGLWPFIEEELKEIYQIKEKEEINKTIKNLIDDRTLGGEDAVLLHAGIFVKFFQDYYSLMYDIYRLNFDYTLEKTPVEEILTDTFVGLRNILLKDEGEEIYLKLTNRTYYIAKPTKQALIHSPEELAKVTRHFLRHIDLWYQKNEFDESENDFYKALKLWLDVESSRLTKVLTSSKNHVLKATYKMKPSTKEVYLAFPVIFLKGLSNFDYKRLEVELSLGTTKEKLIIDSDYRIYQRLGYHTINIVDYLVKKPLENVSLTIYYNKKELYTTDNRLFRDFIIFDEEGTEIFNETDYEGIINLVHDKYERVLDANEYSFLHHTVSELKVNKSRTYRLGEVRLSFKKALTIGLNGRLVKGLDAQINGRGYIVYKELDNFVFESTLKGSDLVLYLNDESYPLLDVVPYDNIYGENFEYEVLFDKINLKSDLYHLVVKDLSGIIIKEIDFLYDKNLKITKNIKRLPLIYDFSISSSFNIIENKKYNYDFSRKYDVNFKFKLNNYEVKYLVDFNIPRYKYELSQTWRALTDIELKSDDLILSRDCRKVVVHWPNEKPIELEVTEIKKEYKVFNLRPLYNFEIPENNDVKLVITFEDNTTKELLLYVVPEVVTKPKLLFTDKGSIMINFDIKCFDPERWMIEIVDDEGRSKTYEFTHQKLVISDFLPYEDYRIKIIEKRSVKFGSTPDSFYEEKFTFVDTEGLFGKTFIVSNVTYLDDLNNSQPEDLRPFAVKFLRKINRNDDHLINTSFDIHNVCYQCEIFKVGRNNALTKIDTKLILFAEVLSERNNALLRIKIEDANGDKIGFDPRRKQIDERLRSRSVLINNLNIKTLEDMLK